MLLDTSGLLCLIDRREPHHSRAVELFESARQRLTHNDVVAELVALATQRGSSRRTVLQLIDELHTGGSVATIHVDEGLHQEALALLRRRADKRWSLCDAVRFIVMNDHGLREALTTDRHFEQAGYVRLLA